MFKFYVKQFDEWTDVDLLSETQKALIEESIVMNDYC